MDQPLVALANPEPDLTMAHSWHTQSELDTFLAHRIRDTLNESSILSFPMDPRAAFSQRHAKRRTRQSW
jgi:hypothetical protein